MLDYNLTGGGRAEWASTVAVTVAARVPTPYGGDVSTITRGLLNMVVRV